MIKNIIALLLFSTSLFKGIAVTRNITINDTIDFTPAYVGNGNIGMVVAADGMTVPKLFLQSCVKQGSSEGVSTIIPSISPLNFTINGKKLPIDGHWRQTLNMDSGEITTHGRINDLDVVVAIRSLRNIPGAVMADISIIALKAEEVDIVVSPIIPAIFTNQSSNSNTVWCEDGGKKIILSQGEYNDGKDAVVASTLFMADKPWETRNGDTVSAQLNTDEKSTLSIISVIYTTNDISDPWNESERMALYLYRQGGQELKSRHYDSWRDLWKGNIVIDGDDRLQDITNVALYSLYSSLREGSRASIAPMGLTSEKYNGHVFWDADCWIMPPLSIISSDLARSIVDFRVSGLDSARKKAAAYGYRGAMYPWEADLKGEESTPTFALTGPLEHHISAVVPIAMMNYFQATADTTFLRDDAWPVIKDCADFWVSRVTLNPDSTYSIKNVVGADEYAIGVDDNAFTNAAAIRALQAATSAGKLLNRKINPRWEEVASKLIFHRSPDGVILEYDGYNGAEIKQADVALLAYPLWIIDSNEEIERTLDFYEPYLDKKNGPAMSHSVMAVNYSRAGEGDKAYELLLLGLEPYLTGSYHQIAETPSNGETYFMTGAGGLLQGLIFGLVGVDISPESGVRQVKSTLPSHITRITINLPNGTQITRTK